MEITLSNGKLKSVSTLAREWINSQHLGREFLNSEVATDLGLNYEETQAMSASISGLCKSGNLSRRRDNTRPSPMRYIYTIEKFPETRTRARPKRYEPDRSNGHAPVAFLPRDSESEIAEMEKQIRKPEITAPPTLAQRLLDIAVEIERMAKEISAPHLELASTEELLMELRARLK